MPTVLIPGEKENVLGPNKYVRGPDMNYDGKQHMLQYRRKKKTQTTITRASSDGLQTQK